MVPLKYSEILRDNITGAQMDIMPNAGHMLMLEQPDQTEDQYKLDPFSTRTIIQFLPGL